MQQLRLQRGVSYFSVDSLLPDGTGPGSGRHHSAAAGPKMGTGPKLGTGQSGTGPITGTGGPIMGTGGPKGGQPGRLSGSSHIPHSQMNSATSEHIVFSGESSLLPYLLAIMFSVHSLIAGVALGINPAVNNTTIATSIALFSHKFIEAISVGSNFVKENVDPSKSGAVIVVYSLMTPLGILLGMVLTSTLVGITAQITQSVALAIAAGSFIYLAFHEISQEQETDGREVCALTKIGLFSTGFLVMAVVALWV
jgi:zinc transporter ZupT